MSVSKKREEFKEGDIVKVSNYCDSTTCKKLHKLGVTGRIVSESSGFYGFRVKFPDQLNISLNTIFLSSCLEKATPTTYKII